jgi:aminopeptidase N
VTVDLHSPLKPNDLVTIVLTYGGFIFGYPEVMAYVKDRIDENYSLLRPDTFAYPMLAEPTFVSVIASYDTKFTYYITERVPKDYRVACGGDMIDSHNISDSSTFVFRSKISTWRINVAVAKFMVLNNSIDNLVVYYLPEDSASARRVLDALRNVITFYSKTFRRPKSYKGYSIIEIPDGWGSQASDYYFLQTAAAFKDSSKIPEVYHEIGHSWQATASGDVQRCRYFDEAFASFFAALAVREFGGDQVFDNEMEKNRNFFVRWTQRDRQVFDTPIVGYGEKELGRHSYTKGAWSLYVLYWLVGKKMFASIIHTMVTELAGRIINFREFQSLCEHVTKRNLQKFFQDWIYGIESSKLLVDKTPITDIVRRY